MEVRSTAAGPNRVTRSGWSSVEDRGQVREIQSLRASKWSHCGVELRIGEGDNPAVTAPLRGGSVKAGARGRARVLSFSAERARMEKLKLWVVVHGIGRRDYLRSSGPGLR